MLGSLRKHLLSLLADQMLREEVEVQVQTDD